MIYNKLGNTGLSVSRIGFGGENVTDADYKTTESIVNTALDAGVNIIDVFMAQPQVRSNLGKALGSRRKDVIIQGHIGSVLKDGQYLRSRDVKLCDTFIKDFLTRFNTDYIDLGMMHFIDTEEDYKLAFESEYIEYVQKLKRDGVIRFIGASSHNPVTSKKMVETGLLDVMLFSSNPAFDMMPSDTVIDSFFNPGNYRKDGFVVDPSREEFYRICESRGVGLTNMKTYAGGLLLGNASPFGPMTHYQCIAYALDRPAIASVLVGARSLEEIKLSLAYEDAPESEKDYSSVISSGSATLKGKCVYCNHCLPCVAGIDVAAVTKYADLAANADPRGTLYEHYSALSAHGSDCVGCGACEKRCPFEVKIRENMARAAGIFGK